MAQADRPSAPTLDPATLSRVAGGLVHELKNPLSTLGLHLSLLEEEWRKDEGPRARRSLQVLGRLRSEVGRLNDILEDFLRYARTDTLELAPTDLNSVVEHVARFVEPELRAQKVGLQVLADQGLPRARADESRLRQALLNLVINARQAMEQRGGQITLITRREGDGLAIEVLDDGPGMSAEVLARCWEPWYSTKAGGSGLGLPTVRRLMEAHGGGMDLQSTPGRGTRAVLRLPAMEDQHSG
ncbi:MAG: ATP-binding protein [Planctomycetota bacterium]|nr:ATP-binding protein [Planctomycetota bacterium]